jgi:hypothetical protein
LGSRKQIQHRAAAQKTAIAGRNGLAKPLEGKRIGAKLPNSHEHEPDWEISIQICISPRFRIYFLHIIHVVWLE